MTSRSLLIVVGTFALGGCAELPEREPLPDWTDGIPDSTDDPDVLPAYALRLRGDLPYRARLAKTGTDEPCSVEPDGTVQGFVEAECTLDIPELNLYGNGFELDYVVPQGACEHVVYRFYQFEAFEVGFGPSTVDITLDEGGNVASETNAINGEPVCEYDHSRLSDDAPNCCLGSYVVNVTDADGGVKSSAAKLWGGSEVDCYDGAAFISPDIPQDSDGWPTAVIVFLGGESFKRTFVLPSLSLDFASNVALANYYDPADHSGNMPAGLMGGSASPFYTFQCFDEAEELLAEVRLVVKEWNQVSEYDAQGNPDTTGTEPISGHPLDDRADWATATPGDDVWIGLAK